MEPMTMSIMAILALFFIIVALVAFRMLTKETNFEDAYGENAMRLFAEEKSSKQKASNKNKNKTKGNDKKKMDNADKEHKHKEHHNKHHEAKKTEEPLIAESVKPAEAMVVESVDKVTEPVVSVSTIETKQGKKKNKAKHHTEEPKVEAAPVEKQVKVTLQESESSQKTKSPVTKKEKVVEKVLEKVSEKASPKEAEPVEAPEKKGKKKRARRAEEPAKDQPCESVMEEVQPLKSEPKLEEVPPPKQVKELKEQPKQTDKPKPKKVIRDITADKLHTRLSAIADLESEYLSFLATYLSDTGAQKTKQTDEIAALRKQISDKERLVLQCTDKLTAAQKKDSDIARLQQSLNDEKNKYTLFEQSVHTQLASGLKDKTYLQHINEQLKTETNAMKEELIKAQNAIKSVPPPVDTTAFQQQIDMMRAELNSSAKKASQLESELNQRTHALKQMQSEIQNREIQMKQTEVMNESHFKDVESRSKMEREFLESKVKETLKTLEEVQALAESKRDEAQKQQAIAVQTAIQHCNNEFSQQMDTLQRKLVSVEKERDAVKQEQGAKSRDEVSKLNGELEKLKDALELEQSMRSTELNKKSDEMTELRKHLDSDLGQLSELNEKLIKAEKAESEQSNKAATLEKELSQMKAQLDAEKSAKEQELKKLRAELDETKKDGPVTLSLITPAETPEQEVMELSRVQGLGAAPPKGFDVNSDGFKQELDQQKKRNHALRESNYKVVEMSQQQSKIYEKRIAELEKECEETLRDERNKTIKAIRNAVPKSVKLETMSSKCTDEQYEQWIENATQALKQQATTSVVVAQPEQIVLKPAVSPSEDQDEKVRTLERKLQRYHSALDTLSSSIEVIEQEAAEKERNYQRQIAQLKHENTQQMNEAKYALRNERDTGVRLDSQAARLRQLLSGGGGGGAGGQGSDALGRVALLNEVHELNTTKAPKEAYSRRTRSGRRNRKQSWNRTAAANRNETAGAMTSHRKKCLSESAAVHVTFKVTDDPRGGSSDGRGSLEDEWEVVG